MKKNVYNIIWADDEIDDLLDEDSIEDLKSNGFKVLGMAHDGQELELYLDQYSEMVDAVIVDANFNESDMEIVSERDTSGLTFARSLYTHKLSKSVPFFIFTNRSDELLKEIYQHNPRFLEDFPRHKRWFKKSGQGEYDEMFEEIKNAVNEKNTQDFQIRNKYVAVFSWLPSEMYGEIMEILKIVEDGDDRNPSVFNNIRKVLDWIMKELSEYGILAIKLTGSNLNDCSRFLGNVDLQKYVPQYIQRQIHSCCTISNEGSHRLVSDEDVRNGTAPFLVRSTVFELLNILVWFNQLPKDDESRRNITNIAVNIASQINNDNTSSDEGQEPIFDDEFHVWHVGDTLISIKRWDGGKVVLFDKQENGSNNPKIKEKYPFYAKYKKV